MSTSSRIPIERLGTIDLDLAETNHVVFHDRLYRFEYIRSQYHGNSTGDSYFRFVSMSDGSATPAFGHGLHMGCAFADHGKMYVSCVENWGKSRFYLLESDDLVHWSEPRLILSDPAWQGYNTSICRAGDGYTMVFELGAPQELVGVPFTMFFAHSPDLRQWSMVPDAVFGRDIYTGGPMLRWFNGYYYLFYLDGSYEKGFRTCVTRSHDLKQWSQSSLVLDIDDSDRRIASEQLTPEQCARIAGAVNINASDLDICEYHGDLYLSYAWGNQRGVEFLAAGRAHCSEQQFCESFF